MTNKHVSDIKRVAGVVLPDRKRVEIGLRYIYGIGPIRAAHICKTLGFEESLRVYQLTQDQITHINEMIDTNYVVEGDLRREVTLNIKRFSDIGCYRGLRHRFGLPKNGQRTHTNARTSRRLAPGRVIRTKKK